VQRTHFCGKIRSRRRQKKEYWRLVHENNSRSSVFGRNSRPKRRDRSSFRARIYFLRERRAISCSTAPKLGARALKKVDSDTWRAFSLRSPSSPFLSGRVLLVALECGCFRRPRVLAHTKRMRQASQRNLSATCDRRLYSERSLISGV